ncbi:hypothetical protein CTA1_5576 [Colletotrichum tanaceti]|uniref:Uncharacterized protein n=1 Tax=Colletotrichum tanaceti TaxID=1306861 RepID=A0A4U6X442_9PEZI|nr:hypothetical protein CTA1_5576 [Colletotrichum tanaceti]
MAPTPGDGGGTTLLAQEGRDAAEEHGDVAPGREALRQRAGGPVLAAQVERVLGVARGVALGRDGGGAAHVQVALGDGAALQGLGRLDDGGDKALVHVPLYVAVEQPHAGVVGAEADDEVAVALDEEGVAAHGVAGEGEAGAGAVREGAGVLFGAVDDLELVAVQVKGVLAVVLVVEDDLDDVVAPEHVGDRVGAVGARVRGVGGADGEGGVERGDLGQDVRLVVEEGAALGVCAVAEVVHLDVEADGVVDPVVNLLLVDGDQRKVVKGVEVVDGGRDRQGLAVVVDEPAGDVGVEAVGDDVEEVLVHGGDDGEVAGLGVVPGGQEEAVTLGRGDVQGVGGGLVGPDAVDLDDAQRVALEPDVVGGEGADVDHADEVGRAGPDVDVEVLGVVHEGRVGHGLGAGGVLDADQLLDEGPGRAVIPVGQGDDEFLVILALVGALGVVDDQGAAEALGVLAVVVGVVPVGADLVKLERRGGVKELPGGMAHWVMPTAPSMWFVPFWNMPWKWRLVLALPRWLWTVRTRRSPLSASMSGSGQWPLTAMVGLSKAPSGLARTHPMFQSSSMVFARTEEEEVKSSARTAKRAKKAGAKEAMMGISSTNRAERGEHWTDSLSRGGV